MQIHLQTDLQVHLVSFHLLRTVVVVKRSLVHLVLTVHQKLVTAQRSEHFVLGELSVPVGSRQSLDVPLDVGVHPIIKLLQTVEISKMKHLYNVVLIQPGEKEITAEADDILNLENTKGQRLD